MKNSKIVAGIVVGVVVAAVLIPKTRKYIYDALCTLTDSFKDLAGKVEDIADDHGDMAGAVNSAKNAVV